jgi:hypothetical protein
VPGTQATGGGGGRGIFICRSAAEVLSQFSVSQKQGEQFFGNSGVRDGALTGRDSSCCPPCPTCLGHPWGGHGVVLAAACNNCHTTDSSSVHLFILKRRSLWRSLLKRPTTLRFRSLVTARGRLSTSGSVSALSSVATKRCVVQPGAAWYNLLQPGVAHTPGIHHRLRCDTI